MKKQTKLWKTKDGSQIRICDMTDTHLRNTIRMLEHKTKLEYQRRILELTEVLMMVSGEIATDTIESELYYLLENNLDPEDVYPIYDNLMYDLERRKK